MKFFYIFLLLIYNSYCYLLINNSIFINKYNINNLKMQKYNFDPLNCNLDKKKYIIFKKNEIKQERLKLN